MEAPHYPRNKCKSLLPRYPLSRSLTLQHVFRKTVYTFPQCLTIIPTCPVAIAFFFLEMHISCMQRAIQSVWNGLFSQCLTPPPCPVVIVEFLEIHVHLSCSNLNQQFFEIHIIIIMHIFVTICMSYMGTVSILPIVGLMFCTFPSLYVA